MRRKKKNLNETIRKALNSVQGKNPDGSDKRFNLQFLTWLAGGIAESSSDKTIRKTGRKVRTGAENSFADYLGEAVSKYARNFFRKNHITSD